ncbi:hypothetical protein ES702_06404 [subsurface metagenome]
MKLRVEGKEILFGLATEKEITLTFAELKDLETLIKILRAITDQGIPQSLLIRL